MESTVLRFWLGDVAQISIYRRSSDETHDLRQELVRKEEIINRLQSDLERVQMQRVSMEKVRLVYLNHVLD